MFHTIYDVLHKKPPKAILIPFTILKATLLVYLKEKEY